MHVHLQGFNYISMSNGISKPSCDWPIMWQLTVSLIEDIVRLHQAVVETLHQAHSGLGLLITRPTVYSVCTEKKTINTETRLQQMLNRAHICTVQKNNSVDYGCK